MNYAQPLATSQDRVSDALWVTYRWMTLGLATTGVVALGMAHSRDAMEILLGQPRPSSSMGCSSRSSAS